MASTTLSPADFRRALGHYPTGVALVAAYEEDGNVAAMVVGTFTAVSLDPPLVGFMPDRKSATWPRIRETGKFSVSVLSADQEYICRAFAGKAPDRMQHLDESAATPRLTDAALWVECSIDAVLPAGDHDFVLGRVMEM